MLKLFVRWCQSVQRRTLWPRSNAGAFGFRQIFSPRGLSTVFFRSRLPLMATFTGRARILLGEYFNEAGLFFHKTGGA